MEIASDDGTLKIVVPKGTTALDDKGAPLTSLEFAIDDIPLVPTEADIIGPVYNLEPNGATFDPPITLIWGYNPADVPSGMSEADLALAYYDEDSNEWVKLSSEVNSATDIITASVDHFTDFAVIAAPPPPPPPPSPTTAVPAAFTTSSLSISPLEINTGESVSISVLVTNTGKEQSSYTVTLKINEALEETKEATLAGGASETVTFTTFQDEVDTYSVDVNGLPGSFVVKEALTPALPVEPEPEPAPPPSTFLSRINWLIYGPAIAVVIFLAIVLIVRRRRQIPFDW
ncbi:MAG: hypothetical protein SU899_02075 [Chloroflexota bacterium]|nr:hypothetical protein [Chloroflexota bacterium]